VGLEEQVELEQLEGQEELELPGELEGQEGQEELELPGELEGQEELEGLELPGGLELPVALVGLAHQVPVGLESTQQHAAVGHLPPSHPVPVTPATTPLPSA